MTKKLTRGLSFLLALALCVSLCACGSYVGKWELERSSFNDEVAAIGGLGIILTNGTLDLKSDNTFSLTYTHHTTVTQDDGDPFTNDNTMLDASISAEGTYVINENDITLTVTHIAAENTVGEKTTSRDTEGSETINAKVEGGKLTFEIEDLTLTFKK